MLVDVDLLFLSIDDDLFLLLWLIYLLFREFLTIIVVDVDDDYYGEIIFDGWFYLLQWKN